MIHLRRSLFITFFSTNAMTVVQFGVTLVLARLLTPAEVGIFSITSVVIGLAAVFRDFGVSSYLQRERDLTPQKIASALGLLLTTSWLLAAGIYLASDSVAAYYGQPGIARVMRVLTLSFCLLPFASFFYSLLSRDLNAGKQAIVNAAGTLVYALTCITLAYRGHSYMALAWANVANISATIVVYLLLRPAGLLRYRGHPVESDQLCARRDSGPGAGKIERPLQRRPVQPRQRPGRHLPADRRAYHQLQRAALYRGASPRQRAAGAAAVQGHQLPDRPGAAGLRRHGRVRARHHHGAVRRQMAERGTAGAHLVRLLRHPDRFFALSGGADGDRPSVSVGAHLRGCRADPNRADRPVRRA